MYLLSNQMSICSDFELLSSESRTIPFRNQSSFLCRSFSFIPRLSVRVLTVIQRRQLSFLSLRQQFRFKDDDAFVCLPLTASGTDRHYITETLRWWIPSRALKTLKPWSGRAREAQLCQKSRSASLLSNRISRTRRSSKSSFK